MAHGICLGPDGSVYCTDAGSHTVSKFTPEGKLLLALGNKDQPSETGYMKQPDPDDMVASIRRSGPPFNSPTGVAVSSSGEIYVTDGYGNARVHKFSPDGILLLSWGEPGDAPGQFRWPHSLLVDKRERVWVVDRRNDRIQIFNTKGEFLSQWTGISYPTGIFIDDEETVYVSQIGRQVNIFTNDGKRLVRWGMSRLLTYQGEDKETALFYAPHTLVVDSRGDLYVGEVPMGEFGVDRGSRTVQKFARRT